jgi:cell division protease FtsH
MGSRRTKGSSSWPPPIGRESWIPPCCARAVLKSFSSGKNYSETKAAQIDEEVTRIVEKAHQRVRKILSERRTVLDDLAHLLS